MRRGNFQPIRDNYRNDLRREQAQGVLQVKERSREDMPVESVIGNSRADMVVKGKAPLLPRGGTRRHGHKAALLLGHSKSKRAADAGAIPDEKLGPVALTLTGTRVSDDLAAATVPSPCAASGKTPSHPMRGSRSIPSASDYFDAMLQDALAGIPSRVSSPSPSPSRGIKTARSQQEITGGSVGRLHRRAESCRWNLDERISDSLRSRHLFPIPDWQSG